MKTPTRRKFIKSLSVLGLSMPLLNVDKTFAQLNDSFTFHSPFMRAGMRIDYPEFSSLVIDSLGQNKVGDNPVLTVSKKKNKYRSKISGKSISYWLQNDQPNSSPAW